jgi:hypothetical protein
MSEIIWYQLADESPADRAMRLDAELHRIFFDGKACSEICRDYLEPTHDIACRVCGAQAETARDLVHGTPPFMESLDAMQLIVESGRFAEVREEFFHWLLAEDKPPYACTIFLYGQTSRGPRGVYFMELGNTRQEAFYLASLSAMGYIVIKEEQGKQ